MAAMETICIHNPSRRGDDIIVDAFFEIQAGIRFRFHESESLVGATAQGARSHALLPRAGHRRIQH